MMKKTELCAVCGGVEEDPRHRVENAVKLEDQHTFKSVRWAKVEAFADSALEFATAVGSDKERVTSVAVSAELGEALGAPLSVRTPFGLLRVDVEPPPVGPLLRVDAYECEFDKLRVEVERIPGSDDAKIRARMEMDSGHPQCPACERKMARVGSKLRKTVVR